MQVHLPQGCKLSPSSFPVPTPTDMIPPTSPYPWNDSNSWPPDFPNTFPKVSSSLFQLPAWHTQFPHTLPCPFPS